MCSVSVVVTHWPVKGELQNWIIDLSGGRQAGVYHSHYSTLHILSRWGMSLGIFLRIMPTPTVVSKTDDIILSKCFFFFFIYFSTQYYPRYHLKTVTTTNLVVLYHKITDTTKTKGGVILSNEFEKFVDYSAEWGVQIIITLLTTFTNGIN